MIKNPYEILGIKEGASMDEIKRAYRRKAKEYHPDLHPDDSTANEKMQQVNQAYDMLCNPDKYRSRQQARANTYSSYSRQNTGAYVNREQQYRRGNWQYTYYTSANGQNPWGAWQNMWNDTSGAQSERHSTGIVNPFRGIFKVVGGILLFRFIITLLRFELFGFFF